jgi:CubicO group peptidase (beta-lactamase class C family)
MTLIPVLALLAGLAAPGPDAARTAKVDAAFAAWDRTGSPGCVVAVYDSGHIAYARGYGMADLERGLRLTPQSVLDLGSISKQFTAFAVHLLARDGRLSLDDEVRRHLPELPDYGRPLTIRHLLHHTSGLRDYLTILELAGFKDEDWTTEDDALQAIVRQRALNYPPGREYLYSNTGYFLLSQVVRRVSGTSLRDFAQERIFGPLGMTHTQYNDRHDRIVPGRALSYVPGKEGGFALALSDFEQTGDGSLLTTVEDLLLWDRNFTEPVVGGPDVIAEMLRPGRLNDGKEIDYASGLRIGRYRGLPTVRHSGSWVGYHNHYLRFPEQKLSVACLCNVSSSDPSILAERAAEAFLGDRMEPARAAPAAPAPSPSPGPASATVSAPEDYAGIYESAEVGGLPLRLVVEQGRLAARHRTLGGLLQPTGPDAFLLGDVKLRFVRDAGPRGRVTGLLLDSDPIQGLRYVRRNAD